MKNLLLALSCALLLALPLRSVAAGPPEVVVVRIAQRNGGATAIVSRGTGKNEKVTFGGGLSERGLVEAGEGYQALIQRLYQEGFALKSTFGGDYHTTLIFTREQ